MLRDLRRLSALLHAPAPRTLGAEDHYSPSARLQRLVQVRDLRCTGPGCPRTATACDLDHEREYALGGETAEWNLSAKSPRCHIARHNGWTASRDRATGITTWTSPAGSTYVRLPAWRPPPSLPDDVILGSPRPADPPPPTSQYPDDRPLYEALPPLM